MEERGIKKRMKVRQKKGRINTQNKPTQNENTAKWNGTCKKEKQVTEPEQMN